MEFKETFKYRRTAAIIVLIAVILLTLFVNPNLKLLSMRSRAVRAYDDSDKTASVKTLLLRSADEAKQVYITAINAGLNPEECKAVLDAYQNLYDAVDSPFNCKQAAVKLFQETGVLIQTIRFSKPDEITLAKIDSHSSVFSKLLEDLSKNKNYIEAAKEYNEARKESISRLVAPWFGEISDFSDFYDRFKELYSLPEKADDQSDIISTVFKTIISWFKSNDEEQDSHESGFSISPVVIIIAIVVVVGLLGKSGGKN